jgi:hypothetical protein
VRVFGSFASDFHGAFGRHRRTAARVARDAGRQPLAGVLSYCWNRLGEEVVSCADAAAPKCSQRTVPKLSVDDGETVRAHLGYAPSKAAVDDMRVKVDGRIVSWRIERGGPFVLFATGPRKNDASYVGCGVLP